MTTHTNDEWPDEYYKTWDDVPEAVKDLAAALSEWPDCAADAVRMVSGSGFYWRGGYFINDENAQVADKAQWQRARELYLAKENKSLTDVFEKQDNRPKLGKWAPGNYSAVCSNCGCKFTGDKRASNCADCAYAKDEQQSDVVEMEDAECPFDIGDKVKRKDGVPLFGCERYEYAFVCSTNPFVCKSADATMTWELLQPTEMELVNPKSEQSKSTEPQKKEWKDGLPPVGITCLFNHLDSENISDWDEVEVIAIYRGHVIFSFREEGNPNFKVYANSDLKQFRPIQSKADKLKEELSRNLYRQMTNLAEQSEDVVSRQRIANCLAEWLISTNRLKGLDE